MNTKEDWKIYDFVDQKDVKLPEQDPNCPTNEWIDGWNAGMDGTTNINPYDQFSKDWHEWQDGYDSAKID